MAGFSMALAEFAMFSDVSNPRDAIPDIENDARNTDSPYQDAIPVRYKTFQNLQNNAIPPKHLFLFT